MALEVEATRYRCTECNRVVYTYVPERCCEFTMLAEPSPDRK